MAVLGLCRLYYEGWAKRSVPTIMRGDPEMAGTAQGRLFPPNNGWHSRVHRLEPRQKLLLGLGGAPGRQVILPGRRGQARVAAEQPFRLGFRKARKLCRLE